MEKVIGARGLNELAHMGLLRPNDKVTQHKESHCVQEDPPGTTLLRKGCEQTVFPAPSNAGWGGAECGSKFLGWCVQVLHQNTTD